jgi:hypothetical protein
MTLSKANPRAKQRWASLGLIVAAMTLLVATAVLAVHDEDFQLDGDVIASTTTNKGGSVQTVDWDSIFDANGNEKAPLPPGFEDAGFKKDFQHTGTTFVTKDTTTYATGSKDTLPISGWQCNFDNNVNSKIDVMNAYAASYVDPQTGDEIVYFALERNTNTGDANVGFWFLQDAVGCESTGGAVDFTGEHRDGDILIVSAFSGGGLVSTINAYRWNGDDATGSLGTTPIASGVDCRSTTVLPGDPACGAANTANITTPWLTANFKDKVGHTLRTAEFFEGGVNLTDTGLGGRCFNTFIGDTRSSTSLTATLFDFASGELGACGSDIVTTPQDGAGNTIPAAGLQIGADARVDVRDHADITVTGVATFGGTVTFSLCGPLALDSTTNCQTGGVQIGDPVAVVGTAGSAAVDSEFATLTSAGRYCWRGDYSGDAGVGVPGSSDPDDATNVSECFLVNPEQPTLTTEASDDVVLGDPIYDTIFLSGTAKQPGTDGVGPGGTINASALSQADADGSISVTAYGPDDPTCTLEAAGGTWPVSIDVEGDGTYGGEGSDTEFTPIALGTYTYVASYSGDDPNTLAAGPSACDDPAEQVTVTGESDLSTEQDWLPNDTAFVTGPIPLNGTLSFTLFDDGTCGEDGGTSQYSEQVAVPAATPSGTGFRTSNTDVLVTETGDYSWLVSYDDAVLADPDPTCEVTAITITN